MYDTCFIEGCTNKTSNRVRLWRCDYLHASPFFRPRCLSCETYICSFICETHENIYGNIHFVHICPNIEWIKLNYYSRASLRFGNGHLFDIQNNKIEVIWGIGWAIYKPVCLNIYEKIYKFDESNLYHLTIRSLLDKLKVNKNNYFGIIPRDIISIIDGYCLWYG